MILGLLQKYWQLILGGIAVLALVFYISGLRSTVESRTAERDLARAQVTVLAEKLETQNTAVADLKDAADADRTLYLAGLEAANRQAVRFEINAADYLNTPIPTDPQEACEVARRTLEEVTR